MKTWAVSSNDAASKAHYFDYMQTPPKAACGHKQFAHHLQEPVAVTEKCKKCLHLMDEEEDFEPAEE